MCYFKIIPFLEKFLGCLLDTWFWAENLYTLLLKRFIFFWKQLIYCNQILYIHYMGKIYILVLPTWFLAYQWGRYGVGLSDCKSKKIAQKYGHSLKVPPKIHKNYSYKLTTIKISFFTAYSSFTWCL